MIKTRDVILFAFVLFAFTASLHAQGGCVDSPEAPTVVLILVGSVGMFFGPSVLRKMLRRDGMK